MTTASYEQYLTSVGIDPATLVIDDTGTLVVEPGDLSPATLGELPVIALEDAAESTSQPPELRLEDQLGEGGMGVVYSATQIPLRRRVAVKVLRNRSAGAVEKGQLLREALVTGSLEHPNIVPVHSLGRAEDGRPMLVMKQIEGTPWRRSMTPLFADDTPSKTDRVDDQLQVLIQVCRAVEFAHSRGIVHRDIKPSNVMIGSFGEVYLLDWGLAVSLQTGTGLPHVSQVRGLAGTPAYMAPEMAAVDDVVDERADLYQLGAVLYELVTGRKRNPGATPLERLASARQGVPASYGPRVPTELIAICDRATAPDPEQRFPQVAAFREALSSFLRHRGSRRLAQQARERLEAYEAALDPEALRSTVRNPHVHSLATEARFGFRLALREWPDNPQAREGLQRLLESMIQFELRRENRGAVAPLMAELPEPRPELQQRFEALGQRMRERKAERRHLERMRDDADLSVVVRQRKEVTFGLGAILALAIGVLFGLRIMGVHEASYPDALGVVSLFTAATFVGRRRLRVSGANLANLRLMDAIAVGSMALGVLFATGWLGGVSFVAMLSAAMTTAAAVAAIVALMVEWRLLPTAAGFVAAAFLVVLFPPYRGLFVALGSLASFAYASWVWHRWVERSEGG